MFKNLDKYKLEAYSFVQSIVMLMCEESPYKPFDKEIVERVEYFAIQKWGDEARKRLVDVGLFETNDVITILDDLTEIGILSSQGDEWDDREETPIETRLLLENR